MQTHGRTLGTAYWRREYALEIAHIALWGGGSPERGEACLPRAPRRRAPPMATYTLAGTQYRTGSMMFLKLSSCLSLPCTDTGHTPPETHPATRRRAAACAGGG